MDAFHIVLMAVSCCSIGLNFSFYKVAKALKAELTAIKSRCVEDDGNATNY